MKGRLFSVEVKVNLKKLSFGVVSVFISILFVLAAQSLIEFGEGEFKDFLTIAILPTLVFGGGGLFLIISSFYNSKDEPK